MKRNKITTVIVGMFLVLVVIVYFFCFNNTQTETSIAWRIDEQEINTDDQQYATKIYLDINGKKSDSPVVTVPSRCHVAGSFPDSPQDVISGVTCWYAGSGDEIVAVKKSGNIEIYYRQSDEGWTDEEAKVNYKWDLIKTLKR